MNKLCRFWKKGGSLLYSLIFNPQKVIHSGRTTKQQKLRVEIDLKVPPSILHATYEDIAGVFSNVIIFTRFTGASNKNIKLLTDKEFVSYHWEESVSSYSSRKVHKRTVIFQGSSWLSPHVCKLKRVFPKLVSVFVLLLYHW